MTSSKLYQLSDLRYPNTFGSSIKSRSYSAGSGFRFGFNGKENFDKYQDYGFRIYYPELGKFLSVDPLKLSFSWNGPYSFAENKPIKSIDLDGLEEISVNTTANQTNFVKLTTITVTMVYYFVSQGKGAINDFPYQNFHDHLTGEKTIYFTKLPSQENESVPIHNKEVVKLAENAAKGDEDAILELKNFGISEVYKATVQFDIDAKNGFTYEEAMQFVELNPQKNGIIMEQMSNDEISEIPDDKIQNFLKAANISFQDPSCMGYGNVEYNDEAASHNFIVLPIAHNGSLNKTESAAHEVGHNLSKWHCHSAENKDCHSRNFEYHDEGLGSNSDPKMSKQNLINTLDDSRNRKTIK